MKDRIVQYPHRYTLMQVSGQPNTFDLVAAPGTITEEGTPLNKGALLSDETAALYGLSGDAATVDKALNAVKTETDDLMNRYTSEAEVYAKIKRGPTGGVVFRDYKTYAVNISIKRGQTSQIVPFGTYDEDTPTFYLYVPKWVDNYRISKYNIYLNGIMILSFGSSAGSVRYVYHRIKKGDVFGIQITADEDYDASFSSITIQLPELI